MVPNVPAPGKPDSGSGSCCGGSPSWFGLGCKTLSTSDDPANLVTAAASAPSCFSSLAWSASRLVRSSDNLFSAARCHVSTFPSRSETASSASSPLMLTDPASPVAASFACLSFNRFSVAVSFSADISLLSPLLNSSVASYAS